MEDVITDIPPPSRFFLEDLNNFAPPPIKNFLHHLPSKVLIGTLVLPEIPFSGNSVESSHTDKSCNIYSLNHAGKTIIIVSVQYAVAAERTHAVAKMLIGEHIIPERVLILDSVQSRNFRGKLPPDETFALKLETSMERKLPVNVPEESKLLKSVCYFPSGSVVDGLAAALLSRCEIKKLKGTLSVSWPEFGGSVTSLVRSLLLKDVVPGLELSINSDGDDEYMRSGVLDSDMYT